MPKLQEPLRELFTRSKLLVLNFSEIPGGTPPDESMEQFFIRNTAKDINPRTPRNRQKFNNRVLAKTNNRYLVSRYAEDRSAMLTGSQIAKEGRTLHLGVDIFCKDLEAVYAPCDGELIRSGNEPENHSFGHFAILRPTDKTLPFIFFGHLNAERVKLGPVKAGDRIATLGDYIHHENGGWSRHLHIQMITKLPPGNKAPLGYSTKEQMTTNLELYPDPLSYFTDWQIEQ